MSEYQWYRENDNERMYRLKRNTYWVSLSPSCDGSGVDAALRCSSDALSKAAFLVSVASVRSNSAHSACLSNMNNSHNISNDHCKLFSTHRRVHHPSRLHLQLSSVLVDIKLLQTKVLEVLTALFHVVSIGNKVHSKYQ